MKQINSDENCNKLIGTESEFRNFLDEVNTLDFRKKISAKSGLGIDEVEATLHVYLSEMMHGYQFVSEYLPDGKLRILEVGAGLGLLSIYLNQLGHEVVALEPAGLAFGFFDTTKQEIWSLPDLKKPVLNEKFAEQLSVEEEGLFDFIFSINVMEHIGDIEAATVAILSLLKPDGICVNSCPNYLVPYEPHYAIPMVPFAKGLTRRLFDAKIGPAPDTWESLNFINWLKVRQMAQKNSATVTFEKELIYQSFLRLGQDEAFMERHRDGMVVRLYRFFRATRLLYLLRFVPVAASTPMVFTYRLKNCRK